MRLDGPWSAAEVAAFLAAAVIPVRLGVVAPSGDPLVLSVWFLPEDGALWCATKGTSRLVACLRHRPRCAFEVAADAPPYRGVRGRGDAAVDPAQGAAVLGRLLDRYGIARESRLARMLTKHPEREVAIRIAPDRMTSWDYAGRMADAVGPTRREEGVQP